MSRWVALGVGLASLSHCVGPTEIVLWVSSDVGCSAQQGLAITVGKPGVDEKGSTTLTTTSCAGDGGLGSLVVLPSGADDDRVGIRVVLGIDASAESCSDNATYDGCIVARRELLFSPHQPLTLPIDLQSSCAGIACLPDTTCVSGTCVDAGVTCTGDMCGLPDASPPPVDAGDGGVCVALTTPTMLAMPAKQMRPRIARTSTGYAVAYLSSANTISLVSVTDAGLISKPFALVIGTTISDIGPFASDGSNFALQYVDAGVHYLLFSDLAGKTLGTLNTLAGNPPNEGMFYVRPQNVYAIANTNASYFSIFTENWNVPASSGSGATTNGPPTNLSVARSGDTFYLTAQDSMSPCLGWICAYTGTFTCSPFVAPAVMACASMKATAFKGIQLVAYDDGAGLLGVQLGSTNISLYPVDNTEAYVPLAVASSARLFYQGSNEIEALSFDATTNTAPSPTPIAALSGWSSGAAFDVVADDAAGSTGWAMAYWTNSAINFVHYCQ